MTDEELIEALERARRNEDDESRRHALELVEDGYRRGELSGRSVYLAIIGVLNQELEAYLAARQ
jgi:hypothetical protein